MKIFKSKWFLKVLTIGGISFFSFTFSEFLFLKTRLVASQPLELSQFFFVNTFSFLKNWFTGLFSWISNPFTAISGFLSNSQYVLRIMTTFLVITSVLGAINVRGNLLLRNRLKAVEIKNYLPLVSLNSSLSDLSNLKKVAFKLPK